MMMLSTGRLGVLTLVGFVAAMLLLAGCQNGEEPPVDEAESADEPAQAEPAPDEEPGGEEDTPPVDERPDEEPPDEQPPDAAGDASQGAAGDRMRPERRPMDVHEAAIAGDLDQVRRYVEEGGDIDAIGGEYDQTPLGMAVMENHADVAEYLVEQGADVNKANHNGIAPLHVASRSGGIESVRLLVENGAIVEATDPRFSPLLWAARVGATDIVAYLIEHGGDVNFVAEGAGGTPLLMAARLGWIETIELLLEHGAETEPEGTFSTALAMGVQSEDTEVVQLLLDHGADPNAPDQQGNSPLRIAGELNLPEIAELLMDHGAEP